MSLNKNDHCVTLVAKTFSCLIASFIAQVTPFAVLTVPFNAVNVRLLNFWLFAMYVIQLVQRVVGGKKNKCNGNVVKYCLVLFV